MSMRDKLRKITVGSPKNFKKEVVELEGEKFEVRQPSVKARGEMMAKAGVTSIRNTDDDMDYSALQAQGVIECTYVPGTNEKVFEEEDFESIINAPSGSWVDELSQTVTKLMNVDPGEDAKN